MTAAFDLHALPSFRDLQGRWSAAVHDNFAARRDLIRSQAIRYVQLAGEEAPGGTGHTVANQIKYETFENGDTAGFRIKLGKVARWQNDGTGIYGPTGERIYPRTAKVLHFFIGGREFFVPRWRVSSQTATSTGLMVAGCQARGLTCARWRSGSSARSTAAAGRR
jgi:hypothetical protein